MALVTIGTIADVGFGFLEFRAGFRGGGNPWAVFDVERDVRKSSIRLLSEPWRLIVRWRVASIVALGWHPLTSPA